MNWKILFVIAFSHLFPVEIQQNLPESKADSSYMHRILEKSRLSIDNRGDKFPEKRGSTHGALPPEVPVSWILTENFKKISADLC
jgi:hypothetical protein